MATKILIGTASWAGKPLIESGEFYPPDVKSPEARLRFYASRFPLVEVDTTYGDLGFTYICVDEPQGFKSSVPPIAAATSDIAFVRFHGRNAETWEKRTKTSAERFDYYYHREELEEWTPRIKSLAGEAREVHAVMNTNNYDQGLRNATMLGELLAEARLEVTPASD